MVRAAIISMTLLFAALVAGAAFAAPSPARAPIVVSMADPQPDQLADESRGAHETGAALDCVAGCARPLPAPSCGERRADEVLIRFFVLGDRPRAAEERAASPPPRAG